MDKSCPSPADSTSHSACSSSSNGRDQYLKHLNKLSHKISKPSTVNKPLAFDHSDLLENQNFNLNQAHSKPQSLSSSQPPPADVQTQQQGLPLQHQPPVYNISKCDFRDVVQKLTGSPSHDRISNPPTIPAPKTQNSRLQRIRPPPLAHVSNRPLHMLNSAVPPAQNPISTAAIAPANFGPIGRPVAPLSPLPPLPTVHAAAESPVSAYMRYLHNSFSTADSNLRQYSGFSPLAPRWSSSTPQQHHLEVIPLRPTPTTMPSHPQIPTPPSPLPFGCLNSPKSPYPLLSPNLLFSPGSAPLGFSQLPLSPTVPLASPKWRSL